MGFSTTSYLPILNYNLTISSSSVNFMNPLNIRSAESCKFDCLSLGEIMLRLDPGDGRVRTARQFQALGRSITLLVVFEDVSDCERL